MAGMRLRVRRPALAREVETRIGAFGLVVVAAVILAAIWSEKNNVLPALVRAGVAALLLNALSVSLAWGLSALLRLDRGQRIAVGFECGLQNFAMAAFIALTLMRDAELLVPAIAYGLTMWLSAFAVVHLTRRSPRADARLAS
jgi:BASS family bile acid:Na+ symporter